MVPRGSDGGRSILEAARPEKISVGASGVIFPIGKKKSASGNQSLVFLFLFLLLSMVCLAVTQIIRLDSDFCSIILL